MNIVNSFPVNILHSVPTTANNQLWDCFHNIFFLLFLSNCIQFPFGLEEPWLISDTAIISPPLFLCFYFVLEKFQELILVFWGHSYIALFSVKLTF